jgi:hypothetical protein
MGLEVIGDLRVDSRLSIQETAGAFGRFAFQ